MNNVPQSRSSARQRAAELLETKPLGDISETDFCYPAPNPGAPWKEGEPNNADTCWAQETGPDALEAFRKWNDRLWSVLSLNAGLLVLALSIMYGSGRTISTFWILVLLGCSLWILVSTRVAFLARSRIMISVFDNIVWHAFEQAKQSPDPWRKIRWLGRAYHLVQYSPCRVKRLEIKQEDEGIRSPNSFDYLKDRLRKAAVLLLSSFPAQGSDEDNIVAERRYNVLLDELLGLMPKLKYRWTIWPHLMAWINLAFSCVAAILGLGALMMLGIKLLSP